MFDCLSRLKHGHDIKSYSYITYTIIKYYIKHNYFWDPTFQIRLRNNYSHITKKYLYNNYPHQSYFPIDFLQ